MNNITVAGQLGRDAEIRHMPNGDPVCSFSVADSQGKDKPTIWWNASLFGKRAESLAPYLLKGQSVTISGTVTEREWTDKDGAKRKSMDVRVADVALQGGKREGSPQAQQAEPRKQAAAARAPTGSTGSGFDDMDDDIPF
jgi:single-strand DNA-binding protein